MKDDLTAIIADAIVEKIKAAELDVLKAPESWPVIMRKADAMDCLGVSAPTVNKMWASKDFPSRDNGAYVGRDALYRWLNRAEK